MGTWFSEVVKLDTFSDLLRRFCLKRGPLFDFRRGPFGVFGVCKKI